MVEQSPCIELIHWKGREMAFRKEKGVTRDWEQIIYLEKPWGSRVQYTRPGWSGTAGGVSCLPLTWLCDLGQVARCLSVPLPYLLSGGNASTTQLIVSARTKWVSIKNPGQQEKAAVGPDVSVENESITSFYIRYHARSFLVLAKEDWVVGSGWLVK